MMQIYHSDEERLAARRKRRLDNLEDRSRKDRDYYARTAERHRERQREARERNPEKTRQSCRDYYRANREKICEYNLWANAKERARNRDLVFTITRDDIIVPEFCPMLGVKLSYEGDRNTSPSLDRIDISKGYVVGNIQVISYRANRIKNDATIEELITIGNWAKEVFNPDQEHLGL